jgi:hypothetical protein
MGDFFKGWRRRIGILTLVLACVVMGSWLRSQKVVDHIIIRCSETGHESLASVDGRLFWISFNPDRNNFKNAKMRMVWPKWEAQLSARPGDSLFGNLHTGSSGWQSFGIGSGVVTRRFPLLDNVLIKFWIIPYWTIVIPLTLLSALLLFFQSPADRFQRLRSNQD